MNNIKIQLYQTITTIVLTIIMISNSLIFVHAGMISPSATNGDEVTVSEDGNTVTITDLSDNDGAVNLHLYTSKYPNATKFIVNAYDVQFNLTGESSCGATKIIELTENVKAFYGDSNGDSPKIAEPLTIIAPNPNMYFPDTANTMTNAWLNSISLKEGTQRVSVIIDAPLNSQARYYAEYFPTVCWVNNAASGSAGLTEEQIKNIINEVLNSGVQLTEDSITKIKEAISEMSSSSITTEDIILAIKNNLLGNSSSHILDTDTFKNNINLLLQKLNIVNTTSINIATPKDNILIGESLPITVYSNLNSNNVTIDVSQSSNIVNINGSAPTTSTPGQWTYTATASKAGQTVVSFTIKSGDVIYGVVQSYITILDESDIKIRESKIPPILYKGDSFSLEVESDVIDLKDYELEWSVNDKVASISNTGVITIKDNTVEEVLVSVKIKGRESTKLTFPITIGSENTNKLITFSQDNYYVLAGDTVNIKPVINSQIIMPIHHKVLNTDIVSVNQFNTNQNTEFAITGKDSGVTTLKVSDEEGNNIAVTNITVIPYNKVELVVKEMPPTLNFGDTYTLNINSSPLNLSVDKYSFIVNDSDKDYISISDKGEISFKNTINQDKTINISVGVKNPSNNTEIGSIINIPINISYKASSISLNTTNLDLNIGDTYTLVATTNIANTSAVITWKSSNQDVVKVDTSGNVIAVGAGQAIITVESEDKTLHSQCVINITDASTDLTNKNAISFENSTYHVLDNNTINIKPNINSLVTGDLTVTIPTANIVSFIVNNSISSNTTHTINKNDTIILKGKKTGTETLTVKDKNGHSTSINITVINSNDININVETVSNSLKYGDTYVLNATTSPVTLNKDELVWEVPDEFKHLIEISSTGIVTVKSYIDSTNVYVTVRVNSPESTNITKIPLILKNDITSISLNTTDIKLSAGSTATLQATTNPAGTLGNIVWASSDTNIATINSSTGLIKAVSVGSATITATTENNLKSQCLVTVTENYIPSTGVSIDTTNIGLKLGQTSTLKANVEPSNVSNPNVLWQSLNGNIARVTSSGEVVATGTGQTSIIATTMDGQFNAVCSVNVYAPISGITLSDTEITIAPEASYTITADLLPVEAMNKKVTWTTSDDKVCRVSDDGTIYAVSTGTATVTATSVEDPSYSANCTVKISPNVEGIWFAESKVSINTGESVLLPIIISPTTTNHPDIKAKCDNDFVKIVSIGDEGIRVEAVSNGKELLHVYCGEHTAVCVIETTTKLSSLQILPQTLNLIAGGVPSKLKAVISPSNADINGLNWTSSNTAVASVDNSGNVTPISAGTAVITVSTADGTITSSCNVYVSADSSSALTTDPKINVYINTFNTSNNTSKQ